jgi:hypothetical protein
MFDYYECLKKFLTKKLCMCAREGYSICVTMEYRHLQLCYISMCACHASVCLLVYWRAPSMRLLCVRPAPAMRYSRIWLVVGCCVVRLLWLQLVTLSLWDLGNIKDKINETSSEVPGKCPRPVRLTSSDLPGGF